MKESETWIVEERNDAIAARRTKYWTGRTCNRGHESRRYTRTGACCKCGTENSMNYQKNKINEIKGAGGPMTQVICMVPRGQEQALRDYVEILNKMVPPAVITRHPALGGGVL